MSEHTRASTSAAQARGKEMEAERVSRLRPSRRARLLAEADQLHAQAARARQAADQFFEQLQAVRAQLGPELTGGSYTQRVREQLQRAERTYPHDRDQAQLRDHNQVAVLRGRVVDHTTAATQAAGRHHQLIAEQQLRARMPAEQRTEEAVFRARWATEQATTQRQRQQQRRRQAQHDPPPRTTQRNLGRGRHDGPSLGR